jgi:hypothetical protein
LPALEIAIRREVQRRPLLLGQPRWRQLLTMPLFPLTYSSITRLYG